MNILLWEIVVQLCTFAWLGALADGRPQEWAVKRRINIVDFILVHSALEGISGGIIMIEDCYLKISYPNMS